MKTLRFPIFIILLFSLLACERFKSGNDTSKTGNETVRETPQRESVYHYVEPEENIAELVWGLLQTENPEVHAVSEALKIVDENYKSTHVIDKSTKTPTKTSLEFKYDLIEGYNDPFIANYGLKCYRTLNDTWLTLVFEQVRDNIEFFDEHFDSQRLFAVEYKDGTLTEVDVETLLPKSFQTLFHFFDYKPWYSHFKFNDDGFEFYEEKYWPIKATWNGKVFEQDPESVLLTKGISNTSGDFYDGSFPIPVGMEPWKIDSDLNHVRKGEVIAHFDVVDNAIVGYRLVSPKYGFAQRECYDSKPVALGFPISNVLDYDRAPKRMKDTTIVTGYKDGKYVITQLLDQDWYNKIEIFVEFSAKDEQSDIESIRVYSKPLTVKLQNQVQSDKKLSQETKDIFKLLDFDDNGESLYALKCTENGFDADYLGQVTVHFQTYKTDDGNYLVALAQYWPSKADTYYYVLAELTFWYYENGTLTETDVELPAPELEEFANRNDEFFIMPEELTPMFKDEGVEYFTLSRYDTDWGPEWEWCTLLYEWNGSTFVKKTN